MNLEDKVLKLVKEKPLLTYELQTKLQVSTVNMIGVLAFLQKHKLVEVTPTSQGDTAIKITERGLQLLNLPDLPEDELPSDQLEVLERHWGDEVDRALDQEADLNLGDKTIDLYTQQAESIKGIATMATRFNTRNSDVICALWAIAKDTVGAKLERDVEDLKKGQKDRKVKLSEPEFSEATVNSIKTREDKRQREIRGVTK